MKISSNCCSIFYVLWCFFPNLFPLEKGKTDKLRCCVIGVFKTLVAIVEVLFHLYNR